MVYLLKQFVHVIEKMNLMDWAPAAGLFGKFVSPNGSIQKIICSEGL